MGNVTSHNPLETNNKTTNELWPTNIKLCMVKEMENRWVKDLACNTALDLGTNDSSKLQKVFEKHEAVEGVCAVLFQKLARPFNQSKAVDAFGLLSMYYCLCYGEAAQKYHALFSLFDFAGNDSLSQTSIVMLCLSLNFSLFLLSSDVPLSHNHTSKFERNARRICRDLLRFQLDSSDSDRKTRTHTHIAEKDLSRQTFVNFCEGFFGGMNEVSINDILLFFDSTLEKSNESNEAVLKNITDIRKEQEHIAMKTQSMDSGPIPSANKKCSGDLQKTLKLRSTKLIAAQKLQCAGRQFLARRASAAKRKLRKRSSKKKLHLAQVRVAALVRGHLARIKIRNRIANEKKQTLIDNEITDAKIANINIDTDSEAKESGE